MNYIVGFVDEVLALANQWKFSPHLKHLWNTKCKEIKTLVKTAIEALEEPIAIEIVMEEVDEAEELKMDREERILAKEEEAAAMKAKSHSMMSGVDKARFDAEKEAAEMIEKRVEEAKIVEAVRIAGVFSVDTTPAQERMLKSLEPYLKRKSEVMGASGSEAGAGPSKAARSVSPAPSTASSVQTDSSPGGFTLVRKTP